MGPACSIDSCDPDGTSSSGFSCTENTAPCCNEDNNCVDGNPCTDDICDTDFGGGGFLGRCSNPLKEGQCCLGSDCDDDNPCTSDGCTPTGCVNDFEPEQFTSCTPDLACEGPDGQCINGDCLPSVGPEVICDDGNPCTIDSCDGTTGFCTKEDIPNCCVADTDCADIDPCTADTCLEGGCDGDIDGDTCFKVENDSLTWFDASEACVAWGGQLVSIHSQAENDFILNLQQDAGCGEVWLGLNDLANEGGYFWSDGTPLDYQNFEAGEPNEWPNCNGGVPEDVVEMYDNGKWNDICSLNPNPCYACARPLVSAGQCQNVECLRSLINEQY